MSDAVTSLYSARATRWSRVLLCIIILLSVVRSLDIEKTHHVSSKTSRRSPLDLSGVEQWCDSLNNTVMTKDPLSYFDSETNAVMTKDSLIYFDSETEHLSFNNAGLDSNIEPCIVGQWC